MLAALGATEEDGSLTDTGKRMTAFPLPPRLARLMVAGQDEQCAVEPAVAALMQGEGVAVKGAERSFARFCGLHGFQAGGARWRRLWMPVLGGGVYPLGHLFRGAREHGWHAGGFCPSAAGKSPGNAGTGFYGGAPCRSQCND
ncbi:MAG: hypothetical protein ACLT38_07920 [Akkermansia sp.]